MAARQAEADRIDENWRDDGTVSVNVLSATTPAIKPDTMTSGFLS
jgi:hypothetical protein